jgi:DNA-binding SARP family transcriptional activator
MSDEHMPDDPMIRDYHACTAKVAKTLDVAGGLAAALDIADYRRVRDRAAEMLDVDAGLRATLDTMIDKSPAIRFRILGSTVIRADGESTTVWGPRRERGVLAVLLLHAGQPMSTETILRWVWPDDAPRPVDVPATIHTYVARLRRKLRSTGDSYQIVARAGSYRLDVDLSTIDYHQFVTLRRDAQRLLRDGQPRQAVDHARRAIELWQSRPLDELNSERAENWRRAAVANEWLPANITLLEALLELGDHTEVLERIDTLQPEHPHDLALMKLRLAVLYALNRGAEAAASYFTARRQLLIAGNDRAAEHLRQLHDNLWEGKAHAGAPIHAAGGLVPRQLPS